MINLTLSHLRSQELPSFLQWKVLNVKYQLLDSFLNSDYMPAVLVI